MTPHAPWLLTAPPWEPDGRGPDSSTQGPASRKCSAGDANATSAVTQLGKLAHAFALVARRKGWRHLITETRGVSNLSEATSSLDHQASRLLQHLRKRGATEPLSTPPYGRGDSAMPPLPEARILQPMASASLRAKRCSISSTRATGSWSPTAKLAAGPSSASPRWALSPNKTDDQGWLWITHSLISKMTPSPWPPVKRCNSGARYNGCSRPY